MKYLCLVYCNEEKLQTSSDTLAIEECKMYTTQLHEGGKLLARESLTPAYTATTVRTRNGSTSVSDGPYAETPDQLAGFYLLNARDLNDAIHLAAGIPEARLGSVEIRPIKESS